ncbi:hypothetical protein [Leptolyngbya sp. NIES-2104]|uniref:hypothetical protein n=1 Tax=Leptolyngbya sp. NIES-2104 TaxID=1552121 RepID=UPI0006EC8037|nr:hypothetical protein [Leptolyngbya sp. NIES-2104]GAP99132.1 hypothetical protein NIES2104_56900 [Leptolyngbya sp. NIES-2104]
MAHYLKWMPQSHYGQQWALTFGAGCLTWFCLVCFARLLPPAVQFLTFLVPILCFIHALHILPKWQKEGRRKDLTESLIERELSHSMMNQHHRNIAVMDLDHNQQMQELGNLYPEQTEEWGTTPHAELAPPEQATYLLKVKQDVMQACGDIGWLCLEYLSAKGTQQADKDGWISIEKIRSNWGRNYGLNTDNLRELLVALTGIQLGEWRDSSMREWRLLLTL